MLTAIESGPSGATAAGAMSIGSGLALTRAYRINKLAELQLSSLRKVNAMVRLDRESDQCQGCSHSFSKKGCAKLMFTQVDADGMVLPQLGTQNVLAREAYHLLDSQAYNHGCFSSIKH